jgi:hypothetical protein
MKILLICNLALSIIIIGTGSLVYKGLIVQTTTGRIAFGGSQTGWLVITIPDNAGPGNNPDQPHTELEFPVTGRQDDKLITHRQVAEMIAIAMNGSTPTPTPTPISTPTPTPLPSATPTPTPTPSSGVQSFTLINADLNTDIGLITNGQIISLSSLPTRNLNVRANTTSTVSSVTFRLNGVLIRTEGARPFALWGDTSGNYSPWTPTVGNYTLSATPNTGAARTVNFTITN